MGRYKFSIDDATLLSCGIDAWESTEVYLLVKHLLQLYPALELFRTLIASENADPPFGFGKGLRAFRQLGINAY